MATISGRVLNEDGTVPVRAHLAVSVQGLGGSNYSPCSYYETPYDAAECYTDPTTGAFSLTVMAGTTTLTVTTQKPDGRYAGPEGTTSGSASLSYTLDAGGLQNGANFYYPGSVHVTGSVTGDFGTLPGQPYLYYYSYDLWGHYLTSTSVFPPNGGGNFDLIVGPGHVDIYPQQSFAGWTTPSAQTGIQVPLDTGVSGLSFVYQQQATINFAFQDDSPTPVRLHCNCYVYLATPTYQYAYYNYDYSFSQDTFGGVPPGIAYTLTPPQISGYQTPASQTVTPTGGNTYTLTFSYRAPRGYITGRVTDNGLTPAGLSGVTVTYRNGSNSLSGSTSTAADGSYSLHLVPDTYTLTFTYYDGRYVMPASITGVVVTDGGSTDNVNATANRWAFITGTLNDTAATPAPVIGAEVAACRGCSSTFADFRATTDGSGAFTLQVDPNQTYAVEPSPQHGLTRLGYSDQGIFDLAVGAVGTTAALPGTLVVARNGTISGRIQDDTSADLANATVQVSYHQYWTNPGCQFCWYGLQIVESGTSDAAGHYSVSAPVGLYDIVEPQFLAGYSTGTNSGYIAVTAATDTANPTPVVYTRDAVASGVVSTDQGTHPVVTVRMEGYDAGYGHYYSDSTTSDPLTGAYSLRLPANSPQLTLHVDDFVSGFGFADPHYVAEAGLSPIQAVTQDFLYHSYGTVEGTVRQENGSAPPGPVHLWVYVTNPRGAQYFCSTYQTTGDPAYCYTDAAGHYSIPVMAGDATVYTTTTFTGIGQAGDVGLHNGGGAPATVAPGATTTGADFVFDNWVSLTVTVNGDFSTLPGPVSVTTYRYDRWGRGQGSNSLTTASGGGNVVFSTAPGSTTVYMSSGFQHWQTPDQQTFSVALDTPAAVTFTYQRLGTIQIVLRDDSVLANTIPYTCCYVYVYSTDGAEPLLPRLHAERWLGRGPTRQLPRDAAEDRSLPGTGGADAGRGRGRHDHLHLHLPALRHRFRQRAQRRDRGRHRQRPGL